MVAELGVSHAGVWLQDALAKGREASGPEQAMQRTMRLGRSRPVYTSDGLGTWGFEGVLGHRIWRCLDMSWFFSSGRKRKQRKPKPFGGSEFLKQVHPCLARLRLRLGGQLASILCLGFCAASIWAACCFLFSFFPLLLPQQLKALGSQPR